MSFKEKEEIARSVLTKYLDLKTAKGRINFVLCIVSILYIFSELQDMSTYHIILKNLIKAIKEGRISKKIGRLIVRRLQRQGLLIDPELLEIINS